ncbi:unnamed protein product [Urochloa humidicola]
MVDGTSGQRFACLDLRNAVAIRRQPRLQRTSADREIQRGRALMARAKNRVPTHIFSGSVSKISGVAEFLHATYPPSKISGGIPKTEAVQGGSKHALDHDEWFICTWDRGGQVGNAPRRPTLRVLPGDAAGNQTLPLHHGSISRRLTVTQFAPEYTTHANANKHLLQMLALTGPYRALGGRSHMYFEFNLKIKGEGAVDEDFSKGYIYRDVVCDTPGELSSLSHESCLSRMELLYMPISSALEASVGVNFLSGKSCFTGKISALTSGNDISKVVLYDSKVRGTETKLGSGGSVPLTRHTLAVPLGEDLVLYVFVRGSNGEKSRRLKFVIGHDVEERACRRGTYELQVKITWKAVFRQVPLGTWKNIEYVRVLW